MEDVSLNNNVTISGELDVNDNVIVRSDPSHNISFFYDNVFSITSDVGGGSVFGTVETLHPGSHNNSFDHASGVVYSPDGRYIAVCNHGEGDIFLYNNSTGTYIDGYITDLGIYAIHGIDYSPDGKYLAISDSSAIGLYNVSTLQKDLTLMYPSPLNIFLFLQMEDTLLLLAVLM